MAKAKKKTANKGRTTCELELLKVMNAAQAVNNQVLECGSAMANTCHDLDSVIWQAADQLKFKRTEGCYNSEWV